MTMYDRAVEEATATITKQVSDQIAAEANRILEKWAEAGEAQAKRPNLPFEIVEDAMLIYLRHRDTNGSHRLLAGHQGRPWTSHFPKIQTIKDVRDVTGWSLVNSKNFVEMVTGFIEGVAATDEHRIAHLESRVAYR